MVSRNMLMLYQQDLQLDPYFVKWQLAIMRVAAYYSLILFFQIDYCGPNSLGWSKIPRIYGRRFFRPGSSGDSINSCLNSPEAHISSDIIVVAQISRVV